MNSFELYQDQYKRHIDELAGFLHGVAWELEEVTISSKYSLGDLLIIVHRGNKKIVYDARQDLLPKNCTPQNVSFLAK